MQAVGDKRLSHAEFRTLAALSSFRDKDTNIAFPGTKHLARMLNKSARAIQKELKAIIDLGYAVVVGYTPGGVRKFFILFGSDQSPKEATAANEAYADSEHLVRPRASIKFGISD